MDPRILPTVLIVIDFISAIVYGFNLDLKNTVYWTAAGVISLSVTWL